MRRVIGFIGAVTLMGLIACTAPIASTESVIPNPIFSPTPLSQPIPGKATVTGIILSLSNQPIPQIPVWLAEVFRQGEGGIYVLDSTSSPGAYTDEKGIFVIHNVNPGEYVIVVGDPESWYEIIAEPSGKAKVWNIPPNQIVEVGKIQVVTWKQ